MNKSFVHFLDKAYADLVIALFIFVVKEEKLSERVTI